MATLLCVILIIAGANTAPTKDAWRPALEKSDAWSEISTSPAAPNCSAPAAYNGPSDSLYAADSPCNTGLFSDNADGSIRSYNLQMTEANLAFLNADPRAEEWVPCDFTVDYGAANANTVGNAKCRYKGSVGSFSGCTGPNGESIAGVGNVGCRKLSFKVKLSGSGRTNKEAAQGSKMLQLLGIMHDDSLIKNRLSYYVMNKMGIDAPCSAPAHIYVNGRYDGIRDMIENIDDVFLEKRFSNSTGGTLYKETWPYSSNASFYSQTNLEALGALGPLAGGLQGTASPGAREQGKNYATSGAAFANFKAAADSCLASGNSCTKEAAAAVLNQYTEPESWIKSLVAIAILQSWDSPVNIKHNFYIFVNGQDKLVYVPWDFNEVLGGDVEGYPRGSSVYSTPGPWYDQVTEADYGSRCIAPSSQGVFTVGSFGCDSVGAIMGIAWRERFFESLTQVGSTIERDLQAMIHRWNLQTDAGLECDAQNGGSPTVATERTQQAVLVPLFQETIEFWQKLGRGEANWPRQVFPSWLGDYLSAYGVPSPMPAVLADPSINIGVMISGTPPCYQYVPCYLWGGRAQYPGTPDCRSIGAGCKSMLETFNWDDINTSY